MKAKLEDISGKTTGVEIESETKEEAQMLLDIWCTHGSLAALDKIGDGNIKLVVVPTVEE